MIVADTNLIAYLLMPGEHTQAAERVYERDPHWSAPLLWGSEFRNVLALHLHRGQLVIGDALELVDLAESLMRGNEFTVASAEVLNLAVQSRRSAYDCELVALARQEQVSLVTTDHEVLNAFPTVAMSPESYGGKK